MLLSNVLDTNGEGGEGYPPPTVGTFWKLTSGFCALYKIQININYSWKCIIIAVQGVGETVFMLLSNVLDIRGEGVGGDIPSHDGETFLIFGVY